MRPLRMISAPKRPTLPTMAALPLFALFASPAAMLPGVAAADEEVNLYSARKEDLIQPLLDRFTEQLTYKAEMEGITVEEVSERDTSKSCSCCGRKRDANRVERGLYVCDECGTTANADVNGAENIRQKVSPSSPNLSVNRSNGWLAQPSTYLFDTETGAFAPQEQVTS